VQRICKYPLFFRDLLCVVCSRIWHAMGRHASSSVLPLDLLCLAFLFAPWSGCVCAGGTCLRPTPTAPRLRPPSLRWTASQGA
jgi:hypothetical protein